MTANNVGTNMNNTETNCLPEYIERNGIHYVLAGDVYLPLIAVSDHPQNTLGTWGRMRRSYLKEHDNDLYTEMLLTGVLHDHLTEIDDAAQRRYNALMDAMQASCCITEELKAEDAHGWAKQMNALAAAVREIVTKEMINC